MPQRKLEAQYVSINGTAVSGAIVNAQPTQGATTPIEKTDPSNAALTYYPGKKTGTFSGEYALDYDAGMVEAVVRPLINKSTEIKWRGSTAAISASNPEATFNVIVTDAGWGGANESEERHSFSWLIDGDITWATS